MRVLVTGGHGFVGSNLVHVLRSSGDQVLAPSHAELDLTDSSATDSYVRSHAPEAIVHAAIWNGFAGLLGDRTRAWAAFVGATNHVVDAANAVDAHIVLVSTDWVFDGTQAPAKEDAPPNPTTTYGVLKLVCEQAVLRRADRGTVARIAGVQGVHRARRATVRAQDAGFGYLVASAVEAMGAGRRFTVWDGQGLNVWASPIAAVDCARLIRLALDRPVEGILHCCGREHVDRVTLVRRAVEVFDLDPDLLAVGVPPAEILPSGGAPRDTRLDSAHTAAALRTRLPGLDDLLATLVVELDPVARL